MTSKKAPKASGEDPRDDEEVDDSGPLLPPEEEAALEAGGEDVDVERAGVGELVDALGDPAEPLELDDVLDALKTGGDESGEIVGSREPAPPVRTDIQREAAETHGAADEAPGVTEEDLDRAPAPERDSQKPQSALEMIGHGETDVTGGERAAKADSLGNQEVAFTDPAAIMMASQMEAEVKARFGRAAARPRDESAARMAIEKECKRPGFAEVARYDLERHSRGSGPSARFSELAARCWRNLDTGSFVVSDTKEGRRIYCYSTDLETNVTEHEMIVVLRTVERSSGYGREVLSVRKKPKGGEVNIVRATDEEMDSKCKNYTSRTLRVLRLRMIPGDVIDDCMGIVVAVQRDAQRADPERFKKILLRSFMSLNIMPEDLAAFLGKPFAKATDRELATLKAVGVRIRDEDEYTWEDALAAKRDLDGQASAAAASPSSPTGSGAVGGAIAAAKARTKKTNPDKEATP